jgi:hypothetical protein
VLAVDQPGEVRLRVPDGANRGVTGGDRGPLVVEHFCGGSPPRHPHPRAGNAHVRGPGEVVPEPVPLGLGQMLDQAEQVSAGGDEHAPKLLVIQPFGLPQDRLTVEVQERERGVQLARTSCPVTSAAPSTSRST